MRYGICTIALLLAALAPGAFAADRAPNVIVIYSDDQGSVDLNCYGSTDLATPRIDSLAARGVRFTQFYAPSAVCSPSRSGLLTGRYPLCAGVPGNVSCTRGDAGMPGAQVTIAEVFKAAGYATGHIGKWHLGYTDETMPNAQGFDHSFGHMGGCIDNYSHFFYWHGPNRHDLWRNGAEVQAGGQFFQDLMIGEAKQFLEANREKPFFLYFAINCPHYPYQGAPKWLEHYKDLPYPRNLYAAFVSTLDDHVGQLLDLVDGLGLRGDTIIVYQSDQGHSTEERAHFGGGNAGPYRGAKASLFEGGIRVPAIISWPGHLPEDAVRAQIAHGCDWLPTLAALCGVPLPETPIDGKSLVPVLEDAEAPTPHDALFWHLSGGKKPLWAVREGDWKLMGDNRDTTDGQARKQVDPRYLVNLAEDIGETANLADQYPEKAAHLEALYNEWLANAQK